MITLRISIILQNRFVYYFIRPSSGNTICESASSINPGWRNLPHDFSACSIARQKISEICATFGGTLVSRYRVSLILLCDKYRGCKGTGNSHNLRSRVDPFYSLFRIDPLLHSLVLCCCSTILSHTFSRSLPSSLSPSFLPLFRCSFLSLLLWESVAIRNAVGSKIDLFMLNL